MGLIKQLPNLITLLNLFCGSVAVIFAINGNFPATAMFMFLGIIFDFFDGFAARLLKAQSPLGLQLDSLADVVTSGLVPGIVMYKLLGLATHVSDGNQEAVWGDSLHFHGVYTTFLPFLGLCITLAAAYRLAKFNIDEDQQSYFKGLPSPANALMIVSLPLIILYQSQSFLKDLILNPWFLVAVTVLSCYLLNSSIKLFALKFKSFAFKPNLVRYVFLLLTIVLLACFQFGGVPLVILAYFLCSLFVNPSEFSR